MTRSSVVALERVGRDLRTPRTRRRWRAGPPRSKQGSGWRRAESSSRSVPLGPSVRERPRAPTAAGLALAAGPNVCRRAADRLTSSTTAGAARILIAPTGRATAACSRGDVQHRSGRRRLTRHGPMGRSGVGRPTMSDGWGFDTAQVHAGAAPDAGTGARATPIYQTTSFVYDSAEQAAASFLLEDLSGFAYSRMSNPTTSVAEQRIARLEGGVSAVATASGQSATALSLLNILRSGDHIVLAGQIYGGTTNLLGQRFAEIGIAVTLVDVRDLEAWRAAIRPTTRAFFTESIGNPTGSSPISRRSPGSRTTRRMCR